MKNFLLLLIFFGLSSCSQPIYNKQDTLTMNLGSEPATLDWNRASDSCSFDVISNLMLGLTRYDLDDNGLLVLSPAIAKSWTISADAKEYIFYLNPEARWSDGKPIIAKHFLDSFQRLLDPATAAPYAGIFEMIDLNLCQIIDDHTLKIILKRPTPYFIYLTAYGPSYPIRLDLIQRYGDNWTEEKNLVSTGAYTLEQWQHEYKIILKANPHYFLAKPKMKFLRFFMIAEQASAYTLFVNKQLDWIDSRSIPKNEFSSLATNPYAHKSFSLMRNCYIGFNFKNSFLANPKIRQALSYAIDREALVKIRSRGDKANATWLPPSLSEYYDQNSVINSSCPNAYCPELARRLLTEAGYPSGKSAPELTFLIPSDEANKTLAEALQAMWKTNLNLDIKIIAMEWKVFLSSLSTNPPDLFRMNWGADYPDPDTFMQLFISGHEMNYGFYSNSRYDELIKQASSLLDINQRRVLYTEAERLLTGDDVAIAPLFINQQTIIHHHNIHGLRVHSLDLALLNQVEKH